MKHGWAGRKGIFCRSGGFDEIDNRGGEGELSGMAWPIKGAAAAIDPARTPGQRDG